jgi:hypothetical protein
MAATQSHTAPPDASVRWGGWLPCPGAASMGESRRLLRWQGLLLRCTGRSRGRLQVLSVLTPHYFRMVLFSNAGNVNTWMNCRSSSSRRLT